MNIRKFLFYSSPFNTRLQTAIFNSMASSNSADALSNVGEPFKAPNNKLKGVFGGSGSDLMNDARPVQRIVDLVGKPCIEIQVLYLGTATYDLLAFQNRQTQRFQELDCQISALKVALDDSLSKKDAEDLIDKADVLVVGGGNTLYAVDRWTSLGLIPALRRAMERGAVMTGGSAGAICWFDGGHSGKF